MTVGNEIMLKRFRQKINIGRDHLTAFRTILLFSETFMYKGIPIQKQWKWKYSKHIFAERVYHFNGTYSKDKYPMYEGRRENFRLKGVNLEKNWMTYRVNFITGFFTNHPAYLSRKLFLTGALGGLVQQLPAGLWVIEGRRKIQKDGTFVNMGYIFGNLFCWLLIRLLAP